MKRSSKNVQTVFVGTVTWFDSQEGVGFIQRKSGPDIYARFSDVIATGFNTLTVGQKVEFTVLNTDSGLIAKNISPC